MPGVNRRPAVHQASENGPQPRQFRPSESRSRIARGAGRVSHSSFWLVLAIQTPWLQSGESIETGASESKGRAVCKSGGRAAAAAGAIILKAAGHLAAPFRLDGQISFGGSGHYGATPADARARPKGRRKNNTHRSVRHSRRRNADRFLSPFRFALRTSRRTEVGSREHSISRCAAANKICIDLSRTGYPRQPGAHESQSIQLAEK